MYAANYLLFAWWCSPVVCRWGCPFLECSAKFNENIMQTFTQVSRLVSFFYTILRLFFTASDGNRKANCSCQAGWVLLTHVIHYFIINVAACILTLSAAVNISIIDFFNIVGCHLQQKRELQRFSVDHSPLCSCNPQLRAREQYMVEKSKGANWRDSPLKHRWGSQF